MSKFSCGLYCFKLLQKYKLQVEQKVDKRDKVNSDEGFFLGIISRLVVVK